MSNEEKPKTPITPVRRFERVGAHSHIKGLGLDGLKALTVADGMVGQNEAREAAGLVVKMIKEGKMAGRAILFAGPPGTGKTAIALGLTKELGNVPFVMLSGSEIYSTELKKTEVLMQAMRKAIGVRLHEMRRIYEGEVESFDVKMTKHPYNPYQQIPESARLTLSTKNETKTFSVGGSITNSMLQQGITVGDVIQIDAESGRVIKLGRSESAAEKFEIEAEKPVPKPSGTIEKEKEFIYLVTLNDLDQMQAQSRGGLLSMFFGGGSTGEIEPEIRQRVDETVKERVEEGTAEIIPGVLFIDDVHMLDIEAYSFISRAMESELAPIIILASNRGITTIRGTELQSPHGMPLDLLDRLLIINTRPYTADEIREILKIRAKEEGVELTDDALEYLTQLGVESSLRYAVQLLSPAGEIARANGRKRVDKPDIEQVKGLFSDIKKSVEQLKQFEKLMMG